MLSVTAHQYLTTHYIGRADYVSFHLNPVLVWLLLLPIGQIQTCATSIIHWFWLNLCRYTIIISTPYAASFALNTTELIQASNDIFYIIRIAHYPWVSLFYPSRSSPS